MSLINILKIMLVTVKTKAENYYEKFISDTVISILVKNIEKNYRIIPKNVIFQKFDVMGGQVNISFLIATQSQGLLLFSSTKIVQLFDYKGFYGVTYNMGEYFAFYKTGLHGNIISFQIQDDKVVNIKLRIWGLSKGIHQIDFIGEDLYVCDTYNNAIIIYKEAHKKKNLYWKLYTTIIFPNGKLDNGRDSSNYNHFNSLFKYDRSIFIVAHNETKKSGRSSELYELCTDSYKLLGKQSLYGSNCHNIYKNEKDTIYFKSLEGIACLNDEDILSYSSILTRGLSVSDDYIIIGGSDIEFNRSNRSNSKGYVFIYNKNYGLLKTITINQTQIQEIRRIDKNEYTYSNNET